MSDVARKHDPVGKICEHLLSAIFDQKTCEPIPNVNSTDFDQAFSSL